MDLYNFFAKIVDGALGFLPRSPFTSFISSIDIPYIEEINYFINVKGILQVFGAWLGVVGLYYTYKIFLRWIKVVGQ